MLTGLAVLLFKVMLVGSIVVFVRSERRRRACQVVGTIAGAMRQNLPLGEALAEASAGDQKVGDILAAVAAGVNAGLPLSEAIRQAYPNCPAFIPASIAAGESVHQARGRLWPSSGNCWPATAARKCSTPCTRSTRWLSWRGC